ncbi:MAG: DNA-binding response regulator, partial [Bacteroidales bacterium]|nr:DNA-binding response regulator [Bacteroidales bacterium]
QEINKDEETAKEGVIYIVEDSHDVAQFLQLCLGKKYSLFFSANGAEAFDNLSSLVPDLIISDVIMPVMDGYELCHKLKKSSTYGHIPVILLSALSGTEDEIKGMKSGADAYIKKPFEPRKLVAKVDTMIANRRNFQKQISSLTSSTLSATNPLSSLDSENSLEGSISEQNNVEGADIQTEELLSLAERNFLKKFYALLDEHLADESFAVENMSRALGIGEAKLYAKVKTLTGQTPKAFFVTYRMNKAMELLKSGEFTVSEVGYKVGATSPAVFSRSFKHQFGISPSSVKE